jgi:mRNA interferase RelE/StbE
MPEDKIAKLNRLLLEKYQTQVMFTANARQDYKSFSAGKRQDILKLIIKQAEKGALLKPDGNANRCEGALHEYAKIKSKSLNLRVIYKPVKLDTGIVRMDIIAIGPRDDLQVYKMAIKRITGEEK